MKVGSLSVGLTYHRSLPGTLLHDIVTLILTAVPFFLSLYLATTGLCAGKGRVPNIVVLLVDDKY